MKIQKFIYRKAKKFSLCFTQTQHGKQMEKDSHGV